MKPEGEKAQMRKLICGLHACPLIISMPTMREASRYALKAKSDAFPAEPSKEG